MTTKLKRQSGQILLIIIFAITLGLVALVGVSTRIVHSTRRVFIDNAYYKAQAAAEAGAERLFLKTTSELAVLSASCTTSLYTANGFNTAELTAHPECIVDLGESRAVVVVEAIPRAGITTYENTSPANSTVSINLQGATSDTNIKVCWQGVNSLGLAYAEILSFYYYEDGSTYKLTQQKHECKGSLAWCASPPAGYSASDGVEDTATLNGFSCFNVLATGTPQLLNLIPLGNGLLYSITFNGSVPIQGYRITSVGEVKSRIVGVGSLADSTASRKKVVVEKSSMPKLGPWFNFAVASELSTIVTD